METMITEAKLSRLSDLLLLRTEVLRDVFSLPPDFDTSELERANRAYYADAIPSGSHIACFAERGGKIIGCGGVCIHSEMPSPDNPSGQCAYLMNIYVRPPYRKLGVGRLIVAWLIERAKALGITKIYLETSNAARGMYEKLGFAPMPDMLMLDRQR